MVYVITLVLYFTIAFMLWYGITTKELPENSTKSEKLAVFILSMLWILVVIMIFEYYIFGTDKTYYLIDRIFDMIEGKEEE